ncbi:glycosyl hydrolase [Paenibacillus rigui]|uniref:glycosyl hydrolase n=1 Tax=Paenibacillus rigui TaxID=554312 RepID=UPI0015C5F52E|nr:glycosyl hydrolase [Paenibacillus rigui]
MSIWVKLQHPPARYRTVPFWSWNDKLENDELVRQIEEMHKAGIGGFFMHARGGLKTPYMGEEWMEAVRTCIEKGKELGMEPWLYDENGWPSGFADGKVPALGLAYQQKRLCFEEAPFQQPMERTIAFYAKSEQGYRLLTESDAEDADLRLYYDVNPYYIDTLSTKAVQAFIESTYEVYWERFGEAFGAQLKGMFTDEPQFARGQMPWSFDLEAVFASRYGYDLKDVLPALFIAAEGCSKARYDYWACVTTMFTEAYAKQIGDWCHSKGWSATGHVVDEQTLMNQVTSVGDPMAFYEYLQIPGCDWLGRFVDAEPLVPKQVSSVTHQLGKKQAITESFGCSGWNVSFQDLKRIGEWQFVHGINLLCQHLQGYTLKGLRKRDYPPSLFYQQPWWEDYRMFNDYFARLSMLLAEGSRQAEVLLLHPIRSAWVEQQDKDSSSIVPYHESFAQLSRWMCQTLIEHDYGSEGIIERHGKVIGDKFFVGKAAYKAVIIPPSVTLNRMTVHLLKQFVRQGGSLIAFSPFPTLINGEVNAEIGQLIGKALQPEWNLEAVLRAVSTVVKPFVRLTDREGRPLASDAINVQTLELDGAYLYYLVNSGEEVYPEVRAELARKGTVSLVDLESGAVIPQQFKETESGVSVTLTLHPAQSRMLKLVPVPVGLEGHQEQAAADSTYGALVQRVALDGPWTISHAEPNSLTLDTCRLRVDEGEWSDVQPVIFVQDQLLAIGQSVPIELEFQFHVEFDTQVARELYLVMENPEHSTIELNGHPVEPSSCGWWRDTSFHKVNISGRAVKGNNTLRLKSYFANSPETYEALERAAKFETEGNKLTFDTEIESIYILGDFGVKALSSYADAERRAVTTDGPFVLTEPPAVVYSGDLVRQGFPFFAGKLIMQQRFHLNRDDWTAAKWVFPAPPDTIVCRLRVNGQEMKAFLWEPYEAEVGSLLRNGENMIELELVNSCRNLLGPHHHIKGEVYKIGPDSFKDKPGWTDKDLEPDTHLYQELYTFVQFGLPVPPYIELLKSTTGAAAAQP